MAKPKIFKDMHYLGVKIERGLWTKLRIYSSVTQDSVGKLVRKILIDWVKTQEEKIK